MTLIKQKQSFNFSIDTILTDGTKSTEVVTLADVNKFSNDFQTDTYAPNRISDLFKFQLYALHKNGINPITVLEEIKNLEAVQLKSRTKSQTKFNHPPLKGLYHKHFLPNSISSIAINMYQGIGQEDGLKNTIEQIVGKSGQEVFTEEIANKLVKAITVDSFEKRRKKRKLTGEWIIYLPYQNENYYLSVCPHSTEENPRDGAIYNNIDTTCFKEWPELKTYLQAMNN